MLATALPIRAFANIDPAGAVAIIERFNGALIATMKDGAQADFGRRFQALAPEVDRAFDLKAILEMSVGSRWSSLSPDQQGHLLDAFRQYSVVAYLASASFGAHNAQSCTILSDTQSLNERCVVVQSRILPAQGDAIELGYVMRQTSSSWKAIDVLAAGSISRVAIQRSDFRRLLVSGGGDALLESLQRKTADLSAGALAYR